MRFMIRCLLLVPVLSLIASCDTQRQKDDRATEPFQRFAARTKERLRAAVMLLSEAPFQMSGIPGGGEPSVEVTFDVKRSTSTVTPHDYTATLTATLRSDGETSSVTADHTFTDGKWHTTKIGDTRPLKQQLERLEERRRAYLRKVAKDKSEEESLAHFEETTRISREIDKILTYSDGESKPAGK